MQAIKSPDRMRPTEEPGCKESDNTNKCGTLPKIDMVATRSSVQANSARPFQASGAAAIVANGIEMTFRSGAQQFQALSNIDLEIQQGEVQLLMGPSGSGKTTLLSILGGLLTPTVGKVCLLGQDLTRMSRSQLSKFRLQHIGFVFQEFNLLPSLTAFENVELLLKLKSSSKQGLRQKTWNLLEQVGLADRASFLPRDLSGGQKQRVAIARALTGNPEIIMADEPTAALDSQNGSAVIALLRRLAKENDRTVVIVTHDSRILDAADRVAYLEDGGLVAQPIAGNLSQMVE